MVFRIHWGPLKLTFGHTNLNPQLTLVLHSMTFFALKKLELMKNIILICTFLITGFSFAQNQGTVKGRITDLDLNNEPMLYANVQVKNTSWKTETNFHGNFEIKNIVPGDYTLVISYLGYDTVELPIVVEKNSVTEVYNGMETKKLTLADMSTENNTESGEETYSMLAKYLKK